MNLVAWILVGCASAVVMAIGSRVAIRHAVAVAELLEVSPFLVGVTLVAVGTDVPEIANSVVASYAGHGDITLGDTTGSVFTQITLCLGVFPFVAGFAIAVVRRDVWLLATLTAVGIVLCALLYRDGSLTRQDAVVLLAFWCAATAVSWQLGARPPPRPSVGGAAHGHWVAHAAKAIVALALVGGASALLVGTVMAVSEAAGVPEYLLSFFGAALATSLPELTVEITAIRRGQRDIALGDVLGSCLVDASLAVAVGPLLFPTRITAELALTGGTIALLGVASAGLLLATRGKHDYWSGGLLLVFYLVGYWISLAPG